jgi:hypothetical protein
VNGHTPRCMISRCCWSVVARNRNCGHTLIYYQIRKVNDWALSFSENFDIQVEAKGKNMASEQLYRQAKENSVI